MSKPTLAHQVISSDSAVYITFMNTNSHTHKQMLRAFYDLSVNLKQVRFLQGLETKIIETKIPVVDDRTVQYIGILLNHFPYIITIVLENDFVVFLCRLETAMREASRA